MRVAVIGIGKMGLLHAGIMNGLEGVDLCAIADSSKFLLGFVKTLKGIPGYTDYRRMLDKEKPDLAIIATPVFLHIPMATECAQRDIPFLIEKPLCLQGDDAIDLVKMVDNKKLTTMVGYMMRYVETFIEARKIIESGVLGEMINFSATIFVSQLFKTGKGWRYNKRQSGGGVVIGQATHLIDMLQWYFGEVKKVSANTMNVYSKEVEDFAHVFFQFDSGVTGWMDSSWSMRHHRLLETEVSINAHNGNLRVNDDCIDLYLDTPAGEYQAGWTYIKRPNLFKGVEIDLGGTHYSRQDIDFIEAARQKKLVDSDLINAFKVQKIVDAIYASATDNGVPVEVESELSI